MMKEHEIPRDEWISDGTYLERIRKQLLSDYYYTERQIKRVKEQIKYYESNVKRNDGLKDAYEVHRDKYTEWLNDLESDLKNLEFLYATTKLKMSLGGLNEKSRQNQNKKESGGK